MSDDHSKPRLYLIRHGETAWSATGRHTGRSDIPLTDTGRANAARLGPALAKHDFDLVLTSPLRRARDTCNLAGFGEVAEVDDDLMEWDYGRYEGITTPQIHESEPGWNVFDHGAPGGETPQQVTARIDRVIARLAALNGEAAVFAHGHLLRALAARWIGQPIGFGKRLLLDTGTLCVLDHYRDNRAAETWNAPVGGM